MQKYVFNNQIPDVDFIIVDEFGFICLYCHDFIYKINKEGKFFECFGDFNQLQLIGEYRNNFAVKYYDKLINNRDDKLINNRDKKFLTNEVLGLSETAMIKEDYILCYRHETRKAYNDKMIKKLGFKRWDQKGVKVIVQLIIYLI